MIENLNDRFNKIIADNRQKIWRICRVYAWNKEDQKDLFQEVALNLWRSLPLFREEAKIDTWVYRICLNVCMQYALKRTKRKKGRIEIEDAKISDSSADIQGNLEHKEEIEKLYDCIS